MAFEYRFGPRVLVKLPLDSTSANIEQGDAITASGATSGFFKEVDALAEAVVGFAVQKVTSPSSDGNAYVLADISRESVYEAPADTGTIAITARMKTCDVGADARSINHDGSTTDDILVIEVDTDANTALVRLNSPTFSGVA